MSLYAVPGPPSKGDQILAALLCLKGVPDLPVAPQDEAGLTKTFQTWPRGLQDLLELTPKKDVLFIIGDWNAKVGNQETPGVTGKFGL